MATDQWGQPVAGERSSVEAWDQAWKHMLHFRGDPIADLAGANETDGSFVLGSVFCGVYAVIGGAPLTSPSVIEALGRVRGRSIDTRELAHLAALTMLAAGEFTDAAEAWAAIAIDH